MMNSWVNKNTSEAQTEVKSKIQKEKKLALCLVVPWVSFSLWQKIYLDVW